MRLLDEHELIENHLDSINNTHKAESNKFRVKLASIVTVILMVLFAVVISMIIFK
jgi:hypothetical protein